MIVQKTSYVQVSSKEAVKYIEENNKDFLITFNEWGDRVNNIKTYKNLADTFTLNPSEAITKSLLNGIGKGKLIIAVIKKDNLEEVKRMKHIGIKYIMIDNAFIYNRKYIAEAFNF